MVHKVVDFHHRHPYNEGMRYGLTGFICLCLMFALAGEISAAELKLWRIGALDTGGKQYNIWYYTGRKPSLYGTTSAGSNVDIYVDNTVSTVRAENTGNWSHNLGDLPDGNHRITLSSEASTYSFMLALGQNASGSATAQLPVTGSAEIALFTAGASALLLGFGYYMRRAGSVA